ncbi:MAG TPA: hypothetical protein VG123_09485, partial [Streptosporangiaceae bacterium]|nr:hypothetical protein [Streptosporangiaceae bacterium]
TRRPAAARTASSASSPAHQIDLSAAPALSCYGNTAVVLAGTNVYTIDDVNGTNDPISASLLGNLIKRARALYKHH